MKTLLERVEISLSCLTVKSWAGREQPSTETGGSEDVKITLFPCLILVIRVILQWFLECWRCWSKGKKRDDRKTVEIPLVAFTHRESTCDRLSPIHRYFLLKSAGPIHSFNLEIGNKVKPRFYKTINKTHQIFSKKTLLETILSVNASQHFSKRITHTGVVCQPWQSLVSKPRLPST